MTSESGTYKLTRPFSNFSKTFLLRALLRFPTIRLDFNDFHPYLINQSKEAEREDDV